MSVIRNGIKSIINLTIKKILILNTILLIILITTCNKRVKLQLFMAIGALDQFLTIKS